MIISHRHRFIFIKTMKTAGTSLEICLSGICGPEDVITPISTADERTRKALGFRGPQNDRVPLASYTKRDWARFFLQRRAQRFYNHMPIREFQPYLQPDEYRDYFKFAVERNPYDKLISAFHFANRNEVRFPTLSDYIRSGLAGQPHGFDLYSLNNEPVVNRIYRFESLPDALDDLTQQLGLNEPLTLPEKKAKGNIRPRGRHYSTYFSPEDKAWADRVFAREIAHYGYTFETEDA